MLIQELTKSDCLGALAHARLGRLACARENQPYVVPFYFVYDKGYLYGFTTPGQTVAWMRSNPRVCVEVEEGGVDSGEWTSIIVFGRYEELPDTPEREQERLRAHELLQQHAEWWQPGCASCALRHAAQPVTPIFYRIWIDRITGRRATASLAPGIRSKKLPSAPGSQGWLRKAFHTLATPFARRRATS
jgi:nitroimidazol reductase NimA-like FMN-containing flavoprotein (pyridoxamine 5'-phosphate oxidase superfamily)